MYSPGIVRPVEKIHRERNDTAINEFEENINKLQNAEEVLNLYYDDALEWIENRT